MKTPMYCFSVTIQQENFTGAKKKEIVRLQQINSVPVADPPEFAPSLATGTIDLIIEDPKEMDVFEAGSTYDLEFTKVVVKV